MWPIWLSHHDCSDSVRCTLVGPFYVCRRCLTIWPLAILVTATSFGRHLPTASGYELAGWLSLATIEYSAVHFRLMSYSAARVWILGAMMGVGAGRLFHRYLQDPTDITSWVTIAACTTPAVIATLYYHLILKKLKGL